MKVRGGGSGEAAAIVDMRVSNVVRGAFVFFTSVRIYLFPWRPWATQKKTDDEFLIHCYSKC